VRVLVLEDGQVLAWVIGHLSPPGTEVLPFNWFGDACHRIERDPPDAVVVSLTAAHLPWREFQRLCASRTPSVPVLYASAEFSNAADAGLEPVEGYADFLYQPASKPEIEVALSKLRAASGEHRRAG
jgi:DNA-binding NtrC family response regulator